jgi:hypothetical protein
MTFSLTHKPLYGYAAFTQKGMLITKGTVKSGGLGIRTSNCRMLSDHVYPVRMPRVKSLTGFTRKVRPSRIKGDTHDEV